MPGTGTKRTNFIYIAFIASALVLLLLAFVSFQLFNRQRSATDLVSHTFRAKLKIEQVVNTLQNSETSQRGYLLTQDTAFLEQFYRAKPAVDSQILQLDSLVADNPQQVALLREIKSLIHHRISIMYKAVESFTMADLPEMVVILQEGRKTMDTIRKHTTWFEHSEDELLKERLEKKDQATKLTSGSILFFTFVSFAVLIFSFTRLRRENLIRTKVEIVSEQLEKKVVERTKEIVDINRQLQEQNVLLEKQNEELNSFTFVASHDLKEPLRKIEMFSLRIEQTEGQNLSKRGREYFNSILSASKRMQNLIDDVLSYAQTNISQQFIPTDLGETLKKAIEILNPTIIEKKAQINASGLPTLSVIPQQMEQLFTNIISNALKYSKTGIPPDINITAKKLKDKVVKGKPGEILWRIDFTDNGIGFDEIHNDRIFQIFQRLHGKSEYSGTGIGLAICKKVAENHKGSISASSSPGKGSTFSLFLPENQI